MARTRWKNHNNQRNLTARVALAVAERFRREAADHGTSVSSRVREVLTAHATESDSGEANDAPSATRG